MDHFVNILVKLFVFLSRFVPVLSKMGLTEYRSFGNFEKDPKLYILLEGYNGAENTGADIRIAEIVKQLTQRIGKENLQISVMTLDKKNLHCYFDADVRLIHFSSVFFIDVFRACCANQVVILCEGSTLKSKFANALTLYFCEAAGIMKAQNKPCIAYGSEAGDMDLFLERTVKKLCSDTYFIARTQNSLKRIQALGLKGHLGTDAAWKFDSTSHTEWAAGQLRQSGWDGEKPLLGIAPINPFWWPVKPSLIKWIKSKITGDKFMQFQLWYFFSYSKQRQRQFENYLNGIASAVNEFAAKYSCHTVILGMERLDADACDRLKKKLKVPASVFLSSDYNGFEMAALLRQLTMLVTSRYHAQVLSMEACVPSIAVSMDERLDNIMEETDMYRHQLLHTNDNELAVKLAQALEYIQSNRENIQYKIGHRLDDYKNRLDEMGDFLAEKLFS